jgi:hypothetical protein
MPRKAESHTEMASLFSARSIPAAHPGRGLTAFGLSYYSGHEVTYLDQGHCGCEIGRMTAARRWQEAVSVQLGADR